MAIAEHLIPRIVHHQEPGITQTFLTGVKERVLQIPMTRKQQPASDMHFQPQPESFVRYKKENTSKRPVTIVVFDKADFL